MSSPAVFLIGTIGSWMYFLPLFLTLGTAVFLALLCRKKGKVFTEKLVLWLLWGNFALHFLKQLNPYYWEEFPFALSRSSMENLCAITILFGPFLYHFGGKYGRDFLYYIGVVSGIVALIFPTGALGRDPGNLKDFLEITRYYVCHCALIYAGILIVAGGLHESNYRRLVALPALFLAQEALVLFNSLFLILIRFPGWPLEFAGAFARDSWVNQSMQVGPQAVMDGIFGPAYPYMFIPGLQVIHTSEGLFFVPVLWLLPFSLLSVFIAGIFMIGKEEYRHIRVDYAVFKMRKAVREKEKRARLALEENEK